jgi:hypothetical protein
MGEKTGRNSVEGATRESVMNGVCGCTAVAESRGDRRRMVCVVCGWASCEKKARHGKREMPVHTRLSSG